MFLETGKKPEENFIYCMWKNYRSLSFTALPSGADLVSQFTGQVSVFGFSPFMVKSQEWAFKDLDFFLVSTGITFPTWKHLNQLSMGKDLQNKLKGLSGQCVQRYLDRDRENFFRPVISVWRTFGAGTVCTFSGFRATEGFEVHKRGTAGQSLWGLWGRSDLSFFSHTKQGGNGKAG